jgi:hypothetical protein
MYESPDLPEAREPARSFKCAHHLDTEVTQYRRSRLCRVVIEKDVMPTSPQARAGPHAEPTAPSETSRRTAANLRG